MFMIVWVGNAVMLAVVQVGAALIGGIQSSVVSQASRALREGLRDCGASRESLVGF